MAFSCGSFWAGLLQERQVVVGRNVVPGASDKPVKRRLYIYRKSTFFGQRGGGHAGVVQSLCEEGDHVLKWVGKCW